ncbi:laccase-22 isoform X2 [Cucumis sativus]|uniref:laccase-22 isoform X2 n=1 Tax=Cucumis sativus TaxID=3659 RepID=UPI0012F47B58|nr:laccase-22 isoform X2 [Cucumis sativus]
MRCIIVFITLLIVLSCGVVVESLVRHYSFIVLLKNERKACGRKDIMTVNGKFPGPTLYAREDDTVIVRVTNRANHNLTIHWHGVRQLRSGWADGPAYITQCPIQPGQNYVYNFTLSSQRGTLLWHAHFSWIRATVHGAIVIFPKHGEWWKSDVEAMVNKSTQLGQPPNVSDAQTINGHPGHVPGCATKRGFTLHVETGKTYLLRIINAALNEDFFFKIASHHFTIVEVDASYTKPFKTNTIFISPGQTTNALVRAHRPIGKYLIAASPFMDAPVAIDNLTATAFLRYKRTPKNSPIVFTHIPPPNSTLLTNQFTDSLRSLNSEEYPAKVPLFIDHNLFFTVGVGVNPCETCVNGVRLVAAVNNVTFLMPQISLLQSHYYNIPGVFTDDFPANPPFVYDYTGKPPTNNQTSNGTKVYRLRFNSTVQLVLQDTAVIAPESHPIHLHGFNVFIVGTGLGNFDPIEDWKGFNLVDPVERNTFGVPNGGWIAIRFRADNPGVWFLHCHLEVHTTWGLRMAFLVENGEGPNESLPPPPSDLPQC